MAVSPDLAVVTPAESVIDSDRGRNVLAGLFTVWLQADAHTLLARRNPSDHRRNMTTEELRSRAESRATHLSACSRLTIRTDQTSETQAASRIVNAYRSR
jgi:shikimate kinase